MPLERPGVDARAVVKTDITPLLIREIVQFTRTRFRPGYEENEVDDFLDVVADWAEDLLRENEILRSQVGLPHKDRYQEYGVPWRASPAGEVPGLTPREETDG